MGLPSVYLMSYTTYKNYVLEEEDQLDIISTKSTAYGYLSVNGGFQIEKFWKSSYFLNPKKKN